MGARDGLALGDAVVGLAEGEADGVRVGSSVGACDGLALGEADGVRVGSAVVGA